MVKLLLLAAFLFDFYAFPESHIILNIVSCLFCLRIIPGSIFVDFTTNNYIIITGFAFPGASGVCIALLKKFSVYSICRKILIAFDNNRVVAFCQNGTIPNCFHNFTSKSIYKLTSLKDV